MKSRIKFGLGDNNREIIEAEVVRTGTDDVRDRIAVGFSDGMGYDSNICYLHYLPSETGINSFRIYPVSSCSNTRLDFKWLASQLEYGQLEKLKEAIDARLSEWVQTACHTTDKSKS